MRNECGLSDECWRRKKISAQHFHSLTSVKKKKRAGLWQTWHLTQLLNHDKCLKKCIIWVICTGVITCCYPFCVFSLCTAPVFLSGTTNAKWFLSWLNSAPWKIMWILQPTELEQNVKRWQPTGSNIQSSPQPWQTGSVVNMALRPHI